MKNKKAIALGISMIALSAVFTIGCGKENPKVKQTQEKELRKAPGFDVAISYRGKDLQGTLDVDQYGLYFYKDGKGDSKLIYWFKDITLKKIRGEAAFNLEVQKGTEKEVFLGLYNDFFVKLDKYADLVQ